MIDVQALNGIYKIEVQELGIPGTNGKNAYELAVSTGEFVGTLEEYVNLPIIAAANANQAADNANQAASDVGSAVIDAEAAALLANEKANLANLAAISANEAAILANNNANLANLAATNANNATGLSETATIATNNAAILANEKADLANLAAINANDKATLANNAVTAANLARDSANNAATLANQRADEANIAAIAANNAAASANAIANSKENKLPNPATSGLVLTSTTAGVKSWIPATEVGRYAQFFSPKQLIAWDNFDRADANPIVKAESGQPYSIWRGTSIGRVSNKYYNGNLNSSFVESSALISVSETKNIGLEISLRRANSGNTSTGIALVKDANNYIVFGRFINTATIFTELPSSTDYQLIVVISGVATVLGSIGVNSIFIGSGLTDPFSYSRITFVFRYANRGRDNASAILVQSLDNPSLKIEVDATTYNSTFLTAADYNKVAIFGNRADLIYAYKVANLNL